MSDKIEIPASALVRCPKVSFNMTRLKACARCVSFDGLADRFPGSSTPFTRRYMALCRHDPTRRELSELQEVAQ